MATVFEYDYQFALSDMKANCEKWGKGVDNYFLVPDATDSIARWIAEFAGRYSIVNNYPDCDNPEARAITYREFAHCLNLFDPRISRVKGADQIIIYESAQKRERGIRLALSPGKAIRRIIPTLPDRYVEKAVDEFKVKFDSANYGIVWGETREDFKLAYEAHNYDAMANIRFTDWRKSLANSCMRDSSRVPDGTCPGEAYASPDFRILMAIRQDNKKVSARCVVRVDCEPYQFAPIYGTNDNGIDLLESELNTKGAIQATDFSGARLLHIPIRGGFLAPYQDVRPGRVDKPDSGDEFMELTDCGDITLFSTAGYVAVRQFTCCECGAVVDPEECDQHNGRRYCEDCYCQEFTCCEECGDTCELDETTEVHQQDSRGNNCTQCVCRDCRSNNYTRCGNGEYWQDDQTYSTADGSTISIDQYENGDWFTSDNDGEIYPGDCRVETVDGESVSRSEAEAMGFVELPSGDWGEPDLATLADLQLTITARNESDIRYQSLRDGQYDLALYLPVVTTLDVVDGHLGELPERHGMTDWRLAESLTLREYPAIVRTESDGRVFYSFERSQRIAGLAFRGVSYSPIVSEYEILAECVAAYRAVNV